MIISACDFVKGACFGFPAGSGGTVMKWHLQSHRFEILC